MPIIDFLDLAIVAPSTWNRRIFRDSESGNKIKAFNGGLYYNSGSPCPLGIHSRFGYKHLPGQRLGKDYPVLPGKYIFGGLLYETHFGHFFAESLCRLWAHYYLGSEYTTIVFFGRDAALSLPSFVHQAMELICPDHTILRVTKPTVFETVAVPEAFIQGSGILKGDPPVRRLSAHLRRDIIDKKIYVSRSRLADKHSFLMEELIEKNLEENGYDIIYPELLTVEEQLSLYASSSHLIFAEGSALHAYALVCSPKQNVYVIWRRGVKGLFTRQISSFGGSILNNDDCVRFAWIPASNELATNPKLKNLKLAQLDFQQLGDSLSRYGFVSKQLWRLPAESELSNALLKAGEERSVTEWDKEYNK